MQNLPIKDIVIVGGGTAGWMTAAALSTILNGRYNIRLVESDEIGIVGVGEATIPMIQRFNRVLGIDEAEFMRATQGSFKLGVEFVNWGRKGERYMHGFGRLGQDLATVPFEQYWLKMRALGKAAPLEEYSIARMAAKAGRFMPARHDVPNSPLADIAYAYHFDASLYARYLRKLSESRGVTRVEGKIVRATQRPGDGYIDAVELENGARIGGDLFIDCSGFRGLLIEQALNTGFEDWSHWLPCDRAWAVPCELGGDLPPYTRASARPAGWQWRIGLQHRTGNGHVFCSAHMDEDEAAATLLARLDGKALAEPRLIKFRTGRRRQAWQRNVVAVGLAGGFLEPLESTSLHMVQTAIARLIDFFPDAGFAQADIDEFNRQSAFEAERIRDFVILHYHLNRRTDSDFWRACAAMAVPETLRHKIDLYRSHGRLVRIADELFAEPGWLQVFEGQGLRPAHPHPLAALRGDDEIAAYLDGVREVIGNCVRAMPAYR